MAIKIRGKPMPPIDIIGHVDLPKLQPADRQKLKEKVDAKIAHLQEVIKALQDTSSKLAKAS
jgi:hypothetical protein